MAQLDARIPLAAQPPDLVGSYERGLSIRDAMDKRQMAEEERQAQRTLADLYRGNVGADGQVNRTGLVQGLASAGQGARIPGVQKQFADMDKAALDVKNTQSQISERDFGLMKKKVETVGAGIASLLADPEATPQHARMLVNSYVDQGMLTPQEGAIAWREIPIDGRFRPYLVRKATELADANKRLDLSLPKVDIRDNGGGFQQFSTNQFTGQTTAGPQLAAKTQTPDSIASNAIAIRGQNLVDARGQEGNRLKAAEIAQGGKPPLGYRWAADGRLEAIPGGPAAGGKGLTEAQGKATAYLGQMRAAESTLGQIAPNQASMTEQANVAMASSPLNMLASAKGQQTRQAQEQWAEAFLRFKTGAAATEGEVKRNVRTFFPQMGDSQAVIDQKARMREQAAADIAIVAGNGAGKAEVVPSISNRSQGVPDDIAAILRKHGGK